MPQAARIFVSHSSENSAWCHTFVLALRSAGADAWYDEHNLGYGGLMDVIEREIRARPIFIVVLSPHAVASRWVQREMQAAIILQDEQPERIIIPVLAEKCDIPVFWRTYKYLSGPSNTSLPATEAAARVAHTLALVPAAAPAAPVPAAPSETAEQAWERGKGLRTQGRHQEALAAFERAVHLDPSDPRYCNSKGLALHEMKRYLEALAAYDDAVELNPTYALAWNGRGNVLWDLKRYEDALSSYKRAIDADPKAAYAWGNTGAALRHLGQRQAALDAYNHALTLSPKLAYAWNYKIALLDELGREAEADEARRQRDAALKGS
jgi:tetratricopeptide (TPR) repeat protein